MEMVIRRWWKGSRIFGLFEDERTAGVPSADLMRESRKFPSIEEEGGARAHGKFFSEDKGIENSGANAFFSCNNRKQRLV